MSRKAGRKAFDSLAFKRRAQEKLYDEIKHLDAEHQREYVSARADSGPLGQWWQSVKLASEANASARGKPATRSGRGKRRAAG